MDSITTQVTSSLHFASCWTERTNKLWFIYWMTASKSAWSHRFNAHLWLRSMDLKQCLCWHLVMKPMDWDVRVPLCGSPYGKPKKRWLPTNLTFVSVLALPCQVRYSWTSRFWIICRPRSPCLEILRKNLASLSLKQNRGFNARSKRSSFSR